MSKFLSNAAVQEFDSEVKHEYQGTETLRECVTNRTGVVGDAYKFTRMGKGLANQKATQADVTPMDITHGRQTANLENWNAPEYTDIFDQAEVNFDEKSELATTIAKAIGRREDQRDPQAQGHLGQQEHGQPVERTERAATGKPVDQQEQAQHQEGQQEVHQVGANHRQRQDPELRGAGPVAPSDPGTAAPRRVHPRCRGDRADHPDRP